jgi:hypothetical protein
MPLTEVSGVGREADGGEILFRAGNSSQQSAAAADMHNMWANGTQEVSVPQETKPKGRTPQAPNTIH